MVAEAEYAFWNDAGIAAQAPADAKPFFKSPRTRRSHTRPRLRRVGQGEIVAGLTAVPARGHTPGHLAVRVSSGTEQLLIWGDVVHMAALQFDRPDWSIAFDTDQAVAAQTRRRLLDMVGGRPHPGRRHASAVPRRRPSGPPRRRLRVRAAALAERIGSRHGAGAISQTISTVALVRTVAGGTTESSCERIGAMRGAISSEPHAWPPAVADLDEPAELDARGRGVDFGLTAGIPHRLPARLVVRLLLRSSPKAICNVMSPLARISPLSRPTPSMSRVTMRADGSP